MTDKKKQVKRIHKKVDELQDEYFQLLMDVVNGKTEIVDENRSYIYHWERLKDLQQQILHYVNVGREIGLEIAREALEDAFTPKIESMLSAKVRKEIEDCG